MLAKTRSILRSGGEVTLVGYGDSITEVGRTPRYYGGASRPDRNWLQVLAQLLCEHFGPGSFFPKHFAIGGHNTYEAVGRVEFLLPLRPHLVLLHLGTNDCGWHELLPWQSEVAMKRLIEEVRAWSGADVLLLLPTGSNPARYHNQKHEPETHDALTRAAADVQCPVIPTRPTFISETQHGARWADFFASPDEIHPTDPGHRLLAQIAFAGLLPLLQS